MATKNGVNESGVTAGLYAQLPVPAEATTSRVVVSNPLLRVVSFAMDAGQELTDHQSPRAVVVQVLDGGLTFTMAGQSSDLSAGDVVYLAPGERHAVLARTACRFSLVMVEPGAAG
ncbi:cupin domain-containing protein [Deinococcus ficus]|uniref:Cupin n=1 Tax=Deinococcus ficus TaxID=317577 RepID=A0A221SWM8_9DEIO|nr:cupin domain-containing protein [Deinococcus ficus]ASN81055.1 cupin [Deinococcus ficus]